MAQHRLKIIIAAGSLAAVMAAGSGDARAFTETKVPPAQPQTSQPTPAPQLQLQKPEAGEGLSLVKPGDTKSGGTELSIPGLGSLGTIPKLDFGLDLLYGDKDEATQDRPIDSDGKDVTIKGTIRHRF
jgi:hypothetical protein